MSDTNNLHNQAIREVLDRIENAAKNIVNPGFLSPSEQNESIKAQAYAMQHQIVLIRSELERNL